MSRSALPVPMMDVSWLRWFRSLTVALGGERRAPASDAGAARSDPGETGVVVVIDLLVVSDWDLQRAADLVIVPQQWDRRVELIEAVAASFLGPGGNSTRRLVISVDTEDHAAMRAGSAARRRWQSPTRELRVDRGRARD